MYVAPIQNGKAASPILLHFKAYLELPLKLMMLDAPGRCQARNKFQDHCSYFLHKLATTLPELLSPFAELHDGFILSV